MKTLERFETAMQKIFNPIAQKVGANKVLQAVAQGCLATVPVTIGIALISILVNLNVGGWGTFLESSGLYSAGQEAIGVTMSLLAIYLLITISFSYSKIRGYNNLIATVLSMAVFLIQIPSTLSLGDGQTITALTADYLGSNGIFVAIIIAVITSAVYCTLMDKGIRKVVVIPNIFNINEPIIFGVPLMLNPYYFIPMVLTPLVNGFVSWGLYSIFRMNLSPSFVLGFPWVTPGIVVDFFVGGIILALIWILCLFLDFVIYLPFTMMDDKTQLQNEQELMNGQEPVATAAEAAE